MKTYIAAAVACAATLAQPAAAVTFPTLTTIYIGSGVRDNGAAANAGVATVFHCSNVSGMAATIRFLVLNHVGIVAASFSTPLAHGSTYTASTHVTAAYNDESLATGAVTEGVINIESTQSGVFCNAKTIDADTEPGFSLTLPLVRVNPHPGTVE